MGATSNKLNYLLETKEAIRNAIEDKGVEVPVETPFREYASKIDELTKPLIFDGELAEIEIHPGKDAFSVEATAEWQEEKQAYAIGKVNVLGAEDLVPDKIRYDATIFGVQGIYKPDNVVLTSSSRTYTANGTYYISPSGSADGLSKVTVTVDVPKTTVEVVANTQIKALTPASLPVTISPDTVDGYNALSSVTIYKDPDLIASNIRNGVNIYGVTGNLVENTIVNNTTVEANWEPDRYVNPGKSTQTITPKYDSASGKYYDGFKRVIVYGDKYLVPDNIKAGETIFGVKGSFVGEPVELKLQSKTVQPKSSEQTITYDSGFGGLDKVTVYGDSKLTPANIAPGVSIFGVTGNYTPKTTTVTVIPGMSTQVITPYNPPGTIEKDKVVGFSSVTVLPISESGEYADENEAYLKGQLQGYADAEVVYKQQIVELNTLINELRAELADKEIAYETGYADGYTVGLEEGKELGRAEVLNNFVDLDSEEY